MINAKEAKKRADERNEVVEKKQLIAAEKGIIEACSLGKYQFKFSENLTDVVIKNLIDEGYEIMDDNTISWVAPKDVDAEDEVVEAVDVLGIDEETEEAEATEEKVEEAPADEEEKEADAAEETEATEEKVEEAPAAEEEKEAGASEEVEATEEKVEETPTAEEEKEAGSSEEAEATE